MKAKKKPAKKPAKKPTPKKTVEKPAAPPSKPAPRADFGKPIDGYFAKQPATMRPILLALRELIEEVIPDAESSIKWGMPHFTLGSGMMVALTGHKAHVNLILAGDPKSFDDPDGKLTGTGTTGRHLKVSSLDDLPRDSVRSWLRTAAAHARNK